MLVLVYGQIHTSIFVMDGRLGRPLVSGGNTNQYPIFALVLPYPIFALVLPVILTCTNVDGTKWTNDPSRVNVETFSLGC